MGKKPYLKEYKMNLTNRHYNKQSHFIVNAKYMFSSNEIDMILTLLITIDKEDIDFKDYIFTLAEFNKKTNKSINTRELKQTIKSLMSKTVEINISENSWKMFNWFSYFQFEKGVLTCRFDKGLKPYLLEIKNRFVISDLRMLLAMKSSYSKRIYLLLKEYSKIGQRSFEIDKLQEILQVPKSFKVYSEFKKKVIKRAETDINKFTDLEVSFTEKKQGRKVVEVTFTIQKNEVDLKSFIEIIRENYANQLLYHTKDNRPLKCSEHGLLYYSDNYENINKKEAQKLWEYLHEHRKELECYEKMDTKKVMRKLILGDQYSFMQYMRENFIDKEVWEKDNMMISVSFTGELFDKRSGEFFDAKTNHELWGELYGLVRLGEVEIF